MWVQFPLGKPNFQCLTLTATSETKGGKQEETAHF